MSYHIMTNAEASLLDQAASLPAALAAQASIPIVVPSPWYNLNQIQSGGSRTINSTGKAVFVNIPRTDIETKRDEIKSVYQLYSQLTFLQKSLTPGLYAIFGPSGSGKTTLLHRAMAEVAGLEEVVHPSEYPSTYPNQSIVDITYASVSEEASSIPYSTNLLMMLPYYPILRESLSQKKSITPSELSVKIHSATGANINANKPHVIFVDSMLLMNDDRHIQGNTGKGGWNKGLNQYFALVSQLARLNRVAVVIVINPLDEFSAQIITNQVMGTMAGFAIANRTARGLVSVRGCMDFNEPYKNGLYREDGSQRDLDGDDSSFDFSSGLTLI